MIILTSVSDFTELAIVNNISIEHNMHADLSILALSQVLHGEYSWSDICMHIYIGRYRSLKISNEPMG